MPLFTAQGPTALPTITYQGPGDVITNAAYGWWGLRAYKQSNIGSNIVQLRYNDATLINYTAQNDGGLPLSTIAADTVTHGSPVIIESLYNQSSGAASGMGRDSPGTTGPAFTLSALNAFPAGTFVSANSEGFQGAPVGTGSAQPITYYALAKSTAGDANTHGIMTCIDGGTEVLIARAPTAGNWLLNAGTGVQVAATDNNWHFGFALFSGASSHLWINDVDSGAINPNVGSIDAGDVPLIGRDGFAHYFEGQIIECGIWFSDESASHTSVYSNVTGYYGALP